MAKHIDFTAQPTSVRLAAHAIGLDYKRPYIRHGRRFYRPYRNGFAASKQSPEGKEWAVMVTCGLARTEVRGNEKALFCLTRKGLDWLGDQLGITIHDEED